MAILKFSAEQSTVYAFQIFVEEVGLLDCFYRDEFSTLGKGPEL